LIPNPKLLLHIITRFRRTIEIIECNRSGKAETRMTQTIEFPTALSAADKSSQAPKSAAAQHCFDLWNIAFEAQTALGKSEYFARKPADKAYRNAMPTLSGYQGICDFIACVAQGQILGVFATDDATKLLFAAQVALSTLRIQPKNQQIDAF